MSARFNKLEESPQVRSTHHVILIGRITEHVSALRIESAQFHTQRIQSTSILKVLQRCAASSRPIPVLATAAYTTVWSPHCTSATGFHGQ